MPICIECRYPVPQLYHVLHSGAHNPSSKTPRVDKSSNTPSGTGAGTKAIPVGGQKSAGTSVGGDVRLTQCPRCKKFADKYVEHDFVVLFIDLVLVKPQVYRHLLFNRLGREDDEFDPSITRLGILLLLFDVYLTWSSIESAPQNLTSSSPIPHLPILLQYAFYLLLSTLTTLAQHLAIRTLASHSFFRQSSIPSANGTNTASKSSSRPNAVSTALFVSSCMKLFPILMVVWKYDDVGGQVGKGVEWAVALQNLEALRILLGCSYFGAGALVAAGSIVRWVVGRLVLGMVGLGEVGDQAVRFWNVKAVVEGVAG
ncbi:sterol homeostasis protein [Loxospora ochrophaea]|nr:sterol homeostasis protein [Loxospora ochrophaea]